MPKLTVKTYIDVDRVRSVLDEYLSEELAKDMLCEMLLECNWAKTSSEELTDGILVEMV